MKSVEQVGEVLSTRFGRVWASCVARREPFVFDVPLYGSGGRTADELTEWAGRWHRWAALHDGDGVRVERADRRLAGIAFRDVPSRLHVEGLEAAARVLGTEEVERVRVARDRADRLCAVYPSVDLAGLAVELPGLVAMTEPRFELLLAAFDWLGPRDPATLAGMAPREVPVAGVHGKWLEQHRWTLAALLGRPLDLRWRYPAQFGARYLDPAHRVSGAREHDLFVVGDAARPLYRPRVVVVVENRRTAWSFPDLEGGLVLEGNGYAASQLTRLHWLHDVPLRLYWGDLDSDGLEILSRVRGAGLPVTSIMTDLRTYEEFEPFGSFHDARGEPIPVPTRRLLPALSDAEAELYDHLCDPHHDRTRRIEQERIPLPAAYAELGKVGAAP